MSASSAARLNEEAERHLGELVAEVGELSQRDLTRARAAARRIRERASRAPQGSRGRRI